jgi:hypothetical protein
MSVRRDTSGPAQALEFQIWADLIRQSHGLLHPYPRLETSVNALSSWYATLDDELKTAIQGLSEDEVPRRTIDRADFPGFTPMLRLQLDIYREVLLIFYSRVDVYLRALRKTPTEQWRKWIG